MDLFTHVLIAYLISYGIWGPSGLQYIAAGALAGGLPDADALFFPLAKRFPLLRHHGITHSITGVTIIAAGGTFLVPHLFAAVIGPSFAAGSPIYYFLAMEVGGLSHVFLDGFTHYAVPPLAPFSEWEFHLDADRAINFGTLALTAVCYVLMGEERGRVPVQFWEVTAWVLLAVYLGYLAVRGIGRFLAGRARKRGGFGGVIPTGNPLVFLLAEDGTSEGRTRLRYARYSVLRGTPDAPREIVLNRNAASTGPVTSAQEALERSYGPSLGLGWRLSDSYHFAEVRSGPGQFLVLWYSLEFTMFGRAVGVLARVDADSGRVSARSAWMAPARFAAGGPVPPARPGYSRLR